jgi:hypothetical protein
MKKDGLQKHQTLNTKARRTSENLNNTNPKEKTMSCLNPNPKIGYFFVHGLVTYETPKLKKTMKPPPQF